MIQIIFVCIEIQLSFELVKDLLILSFRQKINSFLLDGFIMSVLFSSLPSVKVEFRYFD